MMSRNVNKSDGMTSVSGLPYLAVLYDFAPSETLKILFSDVNSKDENNVFWLISLSSKLYKKHDDVYKAVFGSINIFQSYFENVLINSRIYVIANVSGFTRLYELYKICKNGEVLVRHLHTFSTYKKNISNPYFIWNRRSNLRSCTFRIGYFEIRRMVTNKSDDNPVLVNSKNPKRTSL